MKKMFLSLLIASLPLAVFGAAPFELKLYQEDSTAPGFDFTITSLYDGRLVVDYPNIVVNKGKAGCVIYDDKKLGDRVGDYFRKQGNGNTFSAFGMAVLTTAFSSTEDRKKLFRELGVGVEENNKLAFEYGDARKSYMICQKNRILEIVVPTNVGTYTFSFR